MIAKSAILWSTKTGNSREEDVQGARA